MSTDTDEFMTEVKKKNNEQTVRRLMDLSFALRRQEVVKESPLIADFMSRWPALFQENEVIHPNVFKWDFT